MTAPAVSSPRSAALPCPARCRPDRGRPAGSVPPGRSGWGQRDRLSSAALLLRPAAQRAAENSPCNYSSIPPSAGERELKVLPRLLACPVQIVAGRRTRSPGCTRDGGCGRAAPAAAPPAALSCSSGPFPAEQSGLRVGAAPGTGEAAISALFESCPRPQVRRRKRRSPGCVNFCLSAFGAPERTPELSGRQLTPLCGPTRPRFGTGRHRPRCRGLRVQPEGRTRPSPPSSLFFSPPLLFAAVQSRMAILKPTHKGNTV